ncbi:MAG: 50S ribosomal protein L25 [Verrucomicrobiae bacterium]|nr:50S ribosomal protein L25 [Verrucomicrobiae bacterium]
MSSHPTLKANKREESGTNVSRRLRREGIVPAVVYGAAQRTYAVQVDARQFGDVLREQSSGNFLLNLEIEGAEEKTKLAMVQSIQKNPLTGDLIHIDFQAVKANETIHASLPVELLGTSVGVKGGGVLEHQLHSIEVHCRPANLPERLELDISALQIGDALHVSDLVMPEGVETHVDGEVVVVIITEPRVAAAETEGGEEGAEPEVLTAAAED